MAEPKIVKVTPYRGPNQEITEGKKTKISLYDDRLEYVVRYIQKVKVASVADEGIVKETYNLNEEEGFLCKEDIISVVKYIETGYTDDLESYNIHMLDIASSGTSITLSIETEEEKDMLYRELFNWKFKK
jgi:hypothetical protein